MSGSLRQVQAKLSTMISRRRSVRRYLQLPVNQAAIERMLVAATLAPSAHNRQPWRFAVVEDADLKDKLAKAMGQRLRADRLADGDKPKDIDGDIVRSYARITEAPVVILACVDTSDMDAYPDDRRRTAEHLMAAQSTAMAVQNLLLAAQAEGFGACIMCAPLFCPDTVADALRLPNGWQAQMLVTIGVPASTGKTRPRLPLEKMVWRPDSSHMRP